MAREQFAFVVVLVVLAASFGYLVLQSGYWWRGTGIAAVAVLLAGVFRFVLPTVRVGQLAVRGRIFDSTCYLGLGVSMLAVDIRLHH